MQLPDPDYIPAWLSTFLAAVFGVGGVKWLSVILENRRLSRKDFRETLLDRVRELEGVVSRMQVRMGTLRVEMAHLEVENQQLRKLHDCPVRKPNDDDEGSGGSDGR